jgi:hypothetical protein
MLVDLSNLILGKFYLNLVHTCAIFLCADWRMSIWTTWVTFEQWKLCLCHSRNLKGECFDFQETGVTCEFPTISSIEPYQSRAMAFKVHPSKWGFLFLKIPGLPKCFIYKLVLEGTCTNIPNSWHSTQFLYFLGGGASSRNLLLKVYHSWSKYWIDFCWVPTTRLCSRWSHDFCESKKSQSYKSDSTSPSN